MLKNKKLYDKWKEVLELQNVDKSEGEFAARERKMSKSTVLIILSNVTVESNDKCKVLLDKIDELITEGFIVKICFPYKNDLWIDYEEELQQIGVEIVGENGMDELMIVWIKSVANYVENIWIDCTYKKGLIEENMDYYGTIHSFSVSNNTIRFS